MDNGPKKSYNGFSQLRRYDKTGEVLKGRILESINELRDVDRDGWKPYLNYNHGENKFRPRGNQ